MADDMLNYLIIIQRLWRVIKQNNANKEKEMHIIRNYLVISFEDGYTG